MLKNKVCPLGKIAQSVLKNIVIIFLQKLYTFRKDVAPKIIPNGYFSGQNIVQMFEKDGKKIKLGVKSCIFRQAIIISFSIDYNFHILIWVIFARKYKIFARKI